MTRSALAAAVIVIALMPAVALAQPCKCAEADVPATFRLAQAVFEGKLVTIANPEREPSTVRYTFAVTKAWKGTDAGEKITVVADKAGACAVKLSEGASHIVGATDEGMGYASLKPCHRFFKPSSAKDAPALRKSLEGFGNAKPAVSTAQIKEDAKAAVTVAPTKASKKKKQKR